MRAGVFIVVALVGLFMPIWFCILASLCYAFWWTGYELIVLGVLIDAQFGLGTSIFAYTYTLMLGAVVLSAESIKPYLSFYRS
jgi:hypothetical protein